MPDLQEGDQVQIFRGPYDPDDGSERMIMVIWSKDDEVRWWGPPDQATLDRAVKRVEIRVPIEVIQNFITKRPE